MSGDSIEAEETILLNVSFPSCWRKANLSGEEGSLNRDACPWNWNASSPPIPFDDPNKLFGDKDHVG